MYFNRIDAITIIIFNIIIFTIKQLSWHPILIKIIIKEIIKAAAANPDL